MRTAPTDSDPGSPCCPPWRMAGAHVPWGRVQRERDVGLLPDAAFRPFADWFARWHAMRVALLGLCAFVLSGAILALLSWS